MPMIDSDTFKAELDEVDRARRAWRDINARHTPANTTEALKFEATQRLVEYNEATDRLAYKVRKQVELAGGYLSDTDSRKNDI